MALSAGDRLGPYVIVSTLGAGGMGEVYRGRDPRLDRDVAIKIVQAAALADPEWRARFTQEAKAISALSHPNIVTIHDIGTEGDVAYMVMELVDGQTLERLIPANGMRLGDVLRIGAQIADACSRAHAAGIVHRDLKPTNIIVPPDGRVRVLDFGIAKLVAPVAAGTASAETQPTGTSPGMVLGTAAYMSPEQAEGKPLDARSDIFSLGAMLYEMTSGKSPFKGDSPMATMAAVLNQEPAPVSELRRDVPPELARLIMRCLRKDPARRVQSMADLKVTLDELREDADSGRLTAATPVAGRQRTGRIVPVLGGLVVAALAAAGYFAWRSAHPPASAETPEPVPLTAYEGTEADPSFSPDGSQLAFRWNGERQDNFDIYVMLIGSNGAPLRLTTDPRPDFGPQWSPDGRQIAFLRTLAPNRVAVMLVAPLGGPERAIGEFFTMQALGGGPPVARMCWTPDSRYLVLTAAEHEGTPNRLLRVATDTGDVVTLATPGDTNRGYTSPSISPDGRTVAMAHLDSPRSVELLQLSERFEAQGPKTFPSISQVGSVHWTADGSHLLFTYLLNTPLPLYRMSAAGADVTALAWTGAGTGATVAVHGTRLVFERIWRDTNINRVDLASARSGHPVIDRIAQSSFRDVAPQFSPDGTRLAYYTNRAGSIQVWTANADGSQPVQLSSMDAKATTGTPRWSPDGRDISFDSNQGGVYHLYVIPSRGGRARQLTDGPAADYVTSWSPDGKWIYFGSVRGGHEDIWRIPPAGGTPEQVTRFGAAGPTVSADGQWLYFTKKDGTDGLWRVPISGGDPTRLVAQISRYSYAVTPDAVYYAVGGKDAGVFRVDLATNAITRIVSIEKPVDLGLAVSPDGKYLLFTQVDYAGQDLMLVENFR